MTVLKIERLRWAQEKIETLERFGEHEALYLIALFVRNHAGPMRTQ